ncbi:hypothetical protein OSTOST_13150 [Ostertagia ostertagi]
MDLQQFNQLVVHMQSSDNTERSEAEKIYTEMELAPKASLLFSLYCTADAPVELINTVMVESDSRLRKKLLAVVAEVARNTVDEDTGKQNWAEVLQFLEHCMASENVTEVEFVAVLLE